ncbi:MAG: hypothetical protein Q4B13_05300 [Lautropia sp.]|nr:hypothetical protein [Lautropia sp.]
MTSSLSFAFLRTVRQLAFAASSGQGSQMQWNHHGTGTVQVTEDGCDLHFAESFTLENGTVCQDRKCWRFTGHGITFLSRAQTPDMKQHRSIYASRPTSRSKTRFDV